MPAPIRSWFRGLVVRLRCAVSPWLTSREATLAIPGDACPHTTAPEALMRRLVLAVNDPQRFAEVLAETANCAGCQAGLVAELVYTLAGMALDADPQNAEDQPTLSACEHPVIPDVVALRLALAFDAADEEVMGSTLAQILECRTCLASVIMSLTRANVAILNDTKVACHRSWRSLGVFQIRRRTYFQTTVDMVGQLGSEYSVSAVAA